MGPSVEIGGNRNSIPVQVQANTLVAESFPIVNTTIATDVQFQFWIANNLNPNVTMALYVNGNLLAKITQNPNQFGPSIPSHIPLFSQNFFLDLNGTITFASGSVVTIAFLSDASVSITPIEGTGIGNSSMTYNFDSIPSVWNEPPSGSDNGTLFLAVGLVIH